MDRVAKRLGIDGSAEEATPAKPTTATLVKNMLIAGVLLLAVFFVFNKTSFLVATALIALGSAYFWRLAYQVRVKPLVQAGASHSEAVSLTAMQGLWIMPLATFLILHLWGKYSAL